MLTFMRVTTATAVLALLTACGGSKEMAKGSSEEPAVSAAKAALGAAIGAKTGLGVSTDDLPDFAELPPGAKAIHNMKMNQPDSKGGSLSLETSQSLEEVANFYRGVIAKHGLKIMMETAAGDGMMLNTQSEDQKRSLQVLLGRGEDGKTSINLVHVQRKE
jgi:hypothetical protein